MRMQHPIVVVAVAVLLIIVAVLLIMFIVMRTRHESPLLSDCQC